MKSKYNLLYLGLIIFVISGCKKYLVKKPNSHLQVPTNMVELWGLLNNQDVFGYGHTLGLLCADEFYLAPSFYEGKLSPSQRKAYIWDPKIFEATEISNDWEKAYEQIYYANIALEGVKVLKLDTTNDSQLDKIQGDALFKRSHAHFVLAQLFAAAYDPATADVTPGIPLKLQTDPKESIARLTLQACYNKILSDLNEAEELLPRKPDPNLRNRASKAAVLGLKARILLYMGSWQQSAMAAEQALEHHDSLIDFNAIDTSTKNPFQTDTREIIYSLKAPDKGDESAWVVGMASTTDAVNIDTVLKNAYAREDLRLPVFFRHRSDGTWSLKFTRSGSRTPFEGICTSEIFLTLAEAKARQGHTAAALHCLSKLLKNRYKVGQAPALPAGNDEQAVVERILEERKKELCFHGLRWLDIKRLNIQGKKITQVRKINNTVYSIAPNDLRYALPLPAPTVKQYNLEPNAR